MQSLKVIQLINQSINRCNVNDGTQGRHNERCAGDSLIRRICPAVEDDWSNTWWIINRLIDWLIDCDKQSFYRSFHRSFLPISLQIKLADQIPDISWVASASGDPHSNKRSRNVLRYSEKSFEVLGIRSNAIGLWLTLPDSQSMSWCELGRRYTLMYQ